MHVRIASASDAAEGANDVNAIAASARTILARLKHSAGDIGAARRASDRAVTDLASADETVRRLAQAAGRIGEVVTFIQTIARQTSLLALNASIEAVRAGESGQGFAVAASGVKKLAGQTAQETEDIAPAGQGHSAGGRAHRRRAHQCPFQRRLDQSGRPAIA